MKKIEFQKRILRNRRPVIVDFWAPWCAPCRMMEPAMKKATKDYQSKVDLIKINADESREILESLKISSIPTLVAFAGGEEIMRRSGIQNSQMLEMIFDAAIQGKKPAIIPPTQIQRIVRTILGLGVAAFGWFSFHSVFLLIAGGILIFSGFYDRCPIYKAVVPWIVARFRKENGSRNLNIGTTEGE